MRRTRPVVPPERISPGLRFALAALVVASLFAAFAPALTAGFVAWDDDRNFLDHARWRGLSLAHLRWMATTFHGGPYQPLSWATLAIDHALWGMDARAYHATNVGIHALGAVALFALALRLLPLAAPSLRGGRLAGAAAAAALFFGIHPLRVESVAWITERRDVLSGLFLTLSILFYVQFATGDRGDARQRAYWAALGCLLLSLLSKASGMGLPIVLLLLDRWPLQRWPPRKRLASVLIEKVPFALVALPFAALALSGQASQRHTLRGLGEHDLVDRLAQASYSAVFYTLKTLAPTRLAPIYEMSPDFDPLAPRFLAAALATAAATAALFALRRRVPAAWTAWAAFLVIVAPVSGLAQAGPQLVAGGYSYHACMPFALLAAGAVFVWIGGRTAPILALAAAASLGVLTWRQTLLWRDTEKLFRRALEVAPPSYLANNVVGRMLLARGRKEEAAQHFRAAIAIAPLEPNPHTNLGLLLLEIGRVDEAVAELALVLRVRPDYPQGHSNLGVALFSQGRIAEAESELREAARQNPGDPGARVNLGNVFLAQKRFAEAAEQFEAALSLHPRSVEAREGLARARAQR